MNLKHYIGAHSVGSEKTRKAINPFTQEVIGIMPIASEKEIEASIDAARTAFSHWSATTQEERAVFLRGIASGLKKRQQVISNYITLNMGKPIIEARLDVEDAIACYEYYADLLATNCLGDVKPVTVDDTGYAAIKRYAPVGVVGLIVPWNFPTVTTAWKLAPALAAGCTVVLKPSEVTPLAESFLADICDEINLPQGVVNIVYGEAEVGQYLVNSPNIDKVSFTGSTRVGQKIMSASAPTLKNLSLELGGKSSLIVCADADFDEAARLAANGIFFNAGQMCSATSRVLVHETLYAPFLASLKEKVEALSLGDPMLETTNMGPLSCAIQLDKVSSYLSKAEQEGLSCLTGGQVKEGFFVAPTVYENVPATSALWNEEIFGPVLCVAPYSTVDEAIYKANDSEFGLAASVISKDKAAALDIANQLRAGVIWVNTDQVVLPQLSWGGFGQSGIGRELGISGLRSFTELKHIIVELEDVGK